MSNQTDSEPYRPANGMEGAWFDDIFCSNCGRDRKFRETWEAEDGCPILASVMALSIDHPDYPKEWIYKADGPHCTAFEESA